MRFLLILLLTVGVTGGVGGYVMWKQGKLPNIFHKSQTQTEISQSEMEGGSILGASQEVVDKTTQTIEKVIKPFAKQAGVVIENSTSQVLSSTTQPGQINVNQAVEQLKSNAASIPQQVFDKARYDYCQQVVKEYSERY